MRTDEPLAPGPDRPDTPGEVTVSEPDGEEAFLAPPEFLMLPQNRHTLYARCGAVLSDTVQLLGLRRAAHLATIFLRRTRRLARPDQPQDVVPAPAASATGIAVAPEAKTLQPRGRWRRFAPAAVVKGLSSRARNFPSPHPWRSLATAKAAVGRMGLGKHMNSWIGWSKVAPAAFLSRLAHQAMHSFPPKPHRNFRSPVIAAVDQLRTNQLSHLAWLRNSTLASTVRRIAQWPKISHRTDWLGKITAAKVISGSSQRMRKVYRSELWRYSGASAALAVLLVFMGLMVFDQPQAAKTMKSSALPAAQFMEQPSSLPKPLPGKPAAEAATALPLVKPVTLAKATAVAAPQGGRVGLSEVHSIGDDVSVRTFTDSGAAKKKGRPNTRVARIGSDVTVYYFGTTPTAKTPPQ